MGSNSVVVTMNCMFQFIDSHLIHLIASFFEEITTKNSIRSITIFGYKRGTNQNFFNNGRFLVEFESPSVCFEARSSCNRLIILNLAGFGGRKISHLISYELVQQCLRNNNRPDYDKVKFGIYYFFHLLIYTFIHFECPNILIIGLYFVLSFFN
jgi:hypothetical protein